MREKTSLCQYEAKFTPDYNNNLASDHRAVLVAVSNGTL